MHIPKLSLDRSLDLGHHLSQAKAWLGASGGGAHSAAISYAAFEVRLAAERICLQYYVKIVGSKEVKGKPGDMRFRRMKEKIYATAGHQGEIDKQFEFMRAMFRVLGIEIAAPTPNLGRLSAIWNDCSEACHVFWNVGSTTNSLPPEYRPHDDLASYVEELEQFASATATWMRIQDAEFETLRLQHANGTLSDEDLRDALAERGAFAAVTRDGKTQVAGKPIAPKASSSEEDDV